VSLIIDTDPALGIFKKGKPRDIDDGLAIIEAINSPDINLLGITIVFGNSERDQGLQVAKDLVKLKKVNVPILSGAKEASVDPGKPKITPAVQFMAEQLRKKKLKIAAIGPLTNIASLIKNFPEESKNIEEIVVVMGRSKDQYFYIGDFGPVRDFNYVMDPAAARTVVESAVPLALTPFELSVQTLITPKHIAKIRSSNTKSALYLFGKAEAWISFWHKNFPTENGFHPWDSAAIAYLTQRDLLKCENRGYRLRLVSDKAHGVGNKNTGKKAKPQPWFELDSGFTTRKLKYCFDFLPGKKEKFISNIVQNVH